MYIITYSCVFNGHEKKFVHVYGEDDYEVADLFYTLKDKAPGYRHLCLWHNPRLSFSDFVEDADILKAVDFNGKGDKDL